MKVYKRYSNVPAHRDDGTKLPDSIVINEKFSISISPKAVTKPFFKILRPPDQIWSELVHDKRSFLQVYGEYFFVLSAIPPVSGFIGYALVGDAPPLEAAAVALGGYVSCLIFVFLACLWAQGSATLSGGGVSLDLSAKLVMYSLIPFFFTGLFLLHPGLAPFSLFGVYSVFLFFRGVETMTRIPPEKQIFYCILNVLVWIFFIERILFILFS